jgi:hypothetical protein
MSNDANNDSNSNTDKGIRAWFGQRLPEEWPTGDDGIVVDRDEITVLVTLPGPEPADEAGESEQAEAVAGYVAAWRESTRERRIAVAREAERRYRRKVAWGVRVGDRTEVFTHIAVPVMTRLRQRERRVLDTLVDAGVARSRAHALAWCVATVGRNSEQWLGDLREAMGAVERVREAGPEGVSTPPGG